MLNFVLRRFISGLIVLFLFITFVFFAVQAILPGDFAEQFRLVYSEEEIQALRGLLGLDRPVWESYFIWLGNLLRGNLGNSFEQFGLGQPVSQILKTVLPPTLLIFGLGTFVAFLIGQWLGKFVAWRRSGVLSSATTFGSIFLYTSFPPWIAFLGFYLIIMQFGLFSGQYDQDMWRNAGLFPHQIMGRMVILFVVVSLLFYLGNNYLRGLRRPLHPLLLALAFVLAWLLSWWLFGFFPFAIDVLQVAAVPFIIYVVISFGEIMLVMRTTVSDTLNEDYIITARAKGLSDTQVRDRHAARTALLPVISRLVIQLPYLLTGIAMIEFSLSWPGVGSTLFFSTAFQNLTLMMGGALMIGLISLIARLGLDVLQFYLDPRLRTAPPSFHRYR